MTNPNPSRKCAKCGDIDGSHITGCKLAPGVIGTSHDAEVRRYGIDVRHVTFAEEPTPYVDDEPIHEQIVTELGDDFHQTVQILRDIVLVARHKQDLPWEDLNHALKVIRAMAQVQLGDLHGKGYRFPDHGTGVA